MASRSAARVWKCGLLAALCALCWLATDVALDFHLAPKWEADCSQIEASLFSQHCDSIALSGTGTVGDFVCALEFGVFEECEPDQPGVGPGLPDIAAVRA